MSRRLIAEYELIRPDGSLTTTRYLSIPDDALIHQPTGYGTYALLPTARVA